jgi:transcriptional regulator with XRE-family HTH domain
MENTEMKDRIAHIIRAQNLTAAEFALRLGIQPSNISHLLSGRNNPSLEFVKKLKEQLAGSETVPMTEVDENEIVRFTPDENEQYMKKEAVAFKVTP